MMSQLRTANKNANTGEMTVMQRALWASEQTLGVRNYNLEFIQIRISGRLETGALDNAFKELVARHESLQTCYYSIGDEVICGASAVPNRIIEHHELPQNLSLEDKLEMSSWLLEDYRQMGVCLALRPYMKPLLIKVSQESHILLFCFHHLSIDGRSLGIILEELGFLYRKNVGIEKSSLPDPTQYQDFVVWQQRWLSSEEAFQQKENLLSTLEAVDEPYLLPCLKKDLEGDYTSVCLEGVISHEICNKLLSEARAKGLSIFMLLLSRFFLAVYSTHPRKSVTVETGVLNRPIELFERTIGWFSNVLPITINFDVGFKVDLIEEQVLSGVLTILENQNYPFAKLYKERFPQLDQKPFPVWGNIFFNMFGMDDVLDLGPRVQCEFDYLRKLTEATDLTCHVIWEEEDKCSLIRFYYPKKKFDPGLIENMFNSFMKNLSLTNMQLSEWHVPMIKNVNSS